MARDAKKPFDLLLEPVDRITEVLFGLIMVLTSTNTLSVATAGKAEIGTMIWGALGCNLAWGIIDAALYVMGSLAERGRSLMTLRAVREAASPEDAEHLIADALPETVASVMSPGDAASIRAKLLQLPEPPRGPALTRDDALSAGAICLWVFLSTFPVVIPFLFIGEVLPALRFSNAVAIALLFFCGYAFARYTGLRPWPTGLLMVGIGCAMVGVAILLGG
jgi:VIT1/CCC1 family predicted Fe2+/Mn2+ transporter